MTICSTQRSHNHDLWHFYFWFSAKKKPNPYQMKNLLNDCYIHLMTAAKNRVQSRGDHLLSIPTYNWNYGLNYNCKLRTTLFFWRKNQRISCPVLELGKWAFGVMNLYAALLTSPYRRKGFISKTSFKQIDPYRFVGGNTEQYSFPNEILSKYWPGLTVLFFFTD